MTVVDQLLAGLGLTITGMVTVFIYAKLWRRSGVMTDLEFYELRYGGKPASFLRGFRAIYLGVFFNVLIMATVTLAIIKYGQLLFGFSGAHAGAPGGLEDALVDGDGLAVQPVTVAHAGLDGVAEGMAQIEQGAHAALALIGAITAGILVLLWVLEVGDVTAQRRKTIRRNTAQLRNRQR